jgi:hypothetical protein
MHLADARPEAAERFVLLSGHRSCPSPPVLPPVQDYIVAISFQPPDFHLAAVLVGCCVRYGPGLRHICARRCQTVQRDGHICAGGLRHLCAWNSAHMHARGRQRRNPVPSRRKWQIWGAPSGTPFVARRVNAADGMCPVESAHAACLPRGRTESRRRCGSAGGTCAGTLSYKDAELTAVEGLEDFNGLYRTTCQQQRIRRDAPIAYCPKSMRAPCGLPD